MTAAERARLATRLRTEYERAAHAAWEDAGIRGLCGDGRIEAALSAIRNLDVDAILRDNASSDQG